MRRYNLVKMEQNKTLQTERQQDTGAANRKGEIIEWEKNQDETKEKEPLKELSKL